MFNRCACPARSSSSSSPPPAKSSPIPAGASAVRGAAIFRQAGCGSCHVLKAANASGQIGPSLDALRPGFEQTRVQVERGGGGMPSFKGSLSAAQIRDVAAFVATRAGSP